ncbi:MAG: TraB/GumN family protein [Oscillospiraceae bacterium]|jgi:uncharacterized protein YbaP (TraB family)|nr:TraB/GumN family protein [Oscillospiraceae bacterium]
MKKIIALILALMMILTIMAACTDEPAEPVQGTPAGEESASEADDDEADEPDSIVTVIKPSDATPLMWLVTAPDGQTMHLFGSMHVAKPTMYPLPETIMDAFYAADYLAVEIDMLAFINDEEAFMAYVLSRMYDDGMTIIDEIGEELHARAVEVISGLDIDLDGMPIEILDIFKPIVWWNEILTAEAVELSELSSDYGLDMFFLMKAYERGMSVLEVESITAQMEVLLGFSTPLQMILLEGALDIELAAEGIVELYEIYKYGDIEAIILMREAILEEMPEGLGEEYYQGLLANRDIGMTDAIEEYFAEEKSVFFIVGLLHMVGEGGIVDLLTQRGYEVELVAVN